MNYVVSVIHGVADLAGAAEFLCGILGFQQKQTSPDAIIVENGAIAIRLIPRIDSDSPRESLALELQTQDMNGALVELLTHCGINLLSQDLAFIGQERVQTHLQAPHGINITLVQEFNEDQLGIMLPLPTSLIWEEDAESCIKKMLKLVPISFRQPARLRVTERAEMLAGEDASINVSLDTALRALADVTPLFQRPVLMSALQQEGIDPSRYFKESIR
ncbi:MAG: hypothetical protein ACXWE4_04320 [Methylobacter sp.]